MLANVSFGNIKKTSIGMDTKQVKIWERIKFDQYTYFASESFL